jgi:hypothetical protein
MCDICPCAPDDNHEIIVEAVTVGKHGAGTVSGIQPNARTCMLFEIKILPASD